jgi:hypothetical protein
LGEAKSQSCVSLPLRTILEQPRLQAQLSSPRCKGAAPILEYGKWFPVDLDINELVDALRAQATAVIKNPPIAGYVGQANIAQGPQQVINETATRARENETRNKLLEQTTHEPDQWLDRGAPEAAGAGDPQVATVDEIDRS